MNHYWLVRDRKGRITDVGSEVPHNDFAREWLVKKADVVAWLRAAAHSGTPIQVLADELESLR